MDKYRSSWYKDGRVRTYDWMFAGQSTHIRRKQCIEQLKKLPNGFLLETQGFMQGMPVEEYYGVMLQSKIAPCPSGPVELSCARIFEAIECGCVPIVDGLTPFPEYWNAPKPYYWRWFFQTDNLPFPVIYDWSSLPLVISEILKNWELRAQHCSIWWANYKKDFFARVMKDVEELSVQ